jgi:dolichol-phosphate mannosyltransferase
MGDPGTAEMAERPPVVSIVLATFNERLNLPEVVERIRRQELPPYELLVADDGSTDGTREYLQELATRDRRVRLLFHDGKQTTLRAQCQAIEAAAGTYVIVMDADLQHPPETIPALLRELESGAFLTVASRYARGGSAGPRNFSRLVISRGAEWTAKAFLPPAREVSDPVSGFFGFRRSVWVPLNPQYRGYKLLLFLLVMAEGRRISDVGFRFEPRAEGSSKVTQGPAFVRLFLVEVVLARRLERQLRRRAPSFPGVAEPTR